MKEKLIELLSRAVGKILSGRFILTVISGLVFYQVAVVSKILPPEAVSAILSAVFISYFQKKDGNGTN